VMLIERNPQLTAHVLQLGWVDAEYLARQTDRTLKPQIRNNEACALATCLKYRPVEPGVVSGDEIDALEELVEAWPHVAKVGALRVISHVIPWR